MQAPIGAERKRWRPFAPNEAREILCLASLHPVLQAATCSQKHPVHCSTSNIKIHVTTKFHGVRARLAFISLPLVTEKIHSADHFLIRRDRGPRRLERQRAPEVAHTHPLAAGIPANARLKAPTSEQKTASSIVFCSYESRDEWRKTQGETRLSGTRVCACLSSLRMALCRDFACLFGCFVRIRLLFLFTKCRGLTFTSARVLA